MSFEKIAEKITDEMWWWVPKQFAIRAEQRRIDGLRSATVYLFALYSFATCFFSSKVEIRSVDEILFYVSKKLAPTFFTVAEKNGAQREMFFFRAGFRIPGSKG